MHLISKKRQDPKDGGIVLQMGLQAKCRATPNCPLTTKLGLVVGREVRVNTEDPSLKTKQETKSLS